MLALIFHFEGSIPSHSYNCGRLKRCWFFYLIAREAFQVIELTVEDDNDVNSYAKHLATFRSILDIIVRIEHKKRELKFSIQEIEPVSVCLRLVEDWSVFICFIHQYQLNHFY